MSEAPLDTVLMHRCVRRWQEGDRDAADELLRTIGQRLEKLTRRMLRGFPNVKDWAETGDVLQGSVIRLLNSLRNVQPASTRDFFNFAAVHVRRELLDLARRFATRKCGPLAPGAPADASGTDLAADPPAPREDVELWTAFHEAVERLPVEEREVIGLVFYHGWAQAQVAELLGITERTVRRRWQSACLALQDLVGGELPQP